MVILATEGLTKNFGGLRATDSIDLAIEEGKLTSVIGPNGAGKTTLFNLITGMIRPDAGKIIFRGEDITHLPVYQIVRRGISRSFQVINLFNELPLYDNVWLGVQAQQGHGPEVLTSADALSAVREETDRIIKEIGLAGKEQTARKATVRCRGSVKRTLVVAKAASRNPPPRNIPPAKNAPRNSG